MAMKTKTTANVEALTIQGTQLFQQGKLHQAVEIFEDAYRQATQLNNASCECNSAFNLGAVYIANRQPDKALEMLNNAWQRCGGIEDITLKADLYYNYGLTYELLGKDKLAVDHLELALEQYQTQPDKTLATADLAAKIGDVYTKLKNVPQAARNHQVAAELYEQIGEFDKYVVQLCKHATQLFEGGREQGAKEVADTCMVNCQSMKEKETLGHIYNELGLIYSQCSEFEKAVTCFEMALPLCRVSPGGSSNMQAVILQNLGATYNTLRKYQQALQFHEQAAKVHATQSNRKSQGKCFLNLAYAHSQLGDYDKAGEFYLHALQAAKDTESKHDQWQSMEGAGVVAFHENHLERAEKYFTMALDTLKAAPESNSVAYNRIAVKLTDVRKYLMMQETIYVDNKPMVQAPAQILVNDEPRPPTREEQRQMEELREWRLGRKVERQFEGIALGIGEYVSDSDYSVIHRRRHNRRRGQKVVDEVYDEVDYRPASRWSSRTGPQTFRENDLPRKRSHHRTRYDGHRSDTAVGYQHKYVSTRERAESERKHVRNRSTNQRSYSEERHHGRHNSPSMVDDRQLRRHGNHPSERGRRHHHASSSDEETSHDNQFDPKRSGAKERSQSSDSSESESSMDSLARYAEQLGMADEDATDSQDYESGEDDGRENSTNPKEPVAQPGPLGDSSRYLPSPPPVPKHVTPPSPDMLVATYEKPISSDPHADGKMAGNYFRACPANLASESAGDIPRTSKDDDDPSYVTIRSVNRNKASFSEDNEMPSTSYEMAPPVPQRNSGPSSPIRSAGLPYDPNDPEIRELRLDSYGIEREHQYDPLPYRKKKKTTSKMCAVM